jgi:hypothetical protein
MILSRTVLIDQYCYDYMKHVKRAIDYVKKKEERKRIKYDCQEILR